MDSSFYREWGKLYRKLLLITVSAKQDKSYSKLYNKMKIAYKSKIYTFWTVNNLHICCKTNTIDPTIQKGITLY